MENKEIDKQENNKQEANATLTAEENLNYRKDQVFDLTNSSINLTRNMIEDCWIIAIEHNKEAAYVNPYDKLIKMLNWYIKDCNERYAKHLNDNGFKLNKQVKKSLDDAKDRENRNKPAEVVYAKQINELKLGE